MTLTDAPLSTAPAPGAPPASSRLAPVRRVWRQLTSMRTALVLLFLLALAAVPGAFLPQRGLNPLAVQDYFAEHPTLAPLLDRLSLFDVYAAPWFAAVYLLLFVSLIGCLVPRVRLHLRALRTSPPPAPAVFTRLPSSATWQTDAQDVLPEVRRALRGWRVVQRDAALSAERGYLRETGNLLFHISLVVLLVGIALGGLFGFQGSALVVEGRPFASTVLSYDDIRPGRQFAPQDLAPFGFTVKDFHAEYDDAGRALDFAADITWQPDAGDPDVTPQPYELRVNEPLSAGEGARLYLLGHGYAPRLRVVDPSGEVAHDAPVPCLPQDVRFVSNCVLKVPNTSGEQLAFEGVLTPTTAQDPATGRVTSTHPELQAPALTLVGWTGDLGLDSGRPQSVYRIENRSGLRPVEEGEARLLTPGDSWELPDGSVLTWVDTPEWITVQVTQDPGKSVALIASIAMITGLLLSLFVRRRRLWVRTREEGGSTVVEVGGLGRRHRERFAAEFDDLVERLQRIAPPRPERENV